jgi:DNA-binding transcriptional LysR family regulator
MMIGASGIGMDLRGIDLNLLTLFEVVYSTGNVGRAARHLGLTQSAASNGLGRLRKLIDDPLFSRSANGVAPTARAQQLIGPVREALKLISTGLSNDQSIDLATYRRQFRMLMYDPIEPVVMPPVIRLLSQRAPGISIEGIPASSGDHIAQMREGSLDMAIYVYPPLDAPDIVKVSLGPLDIVVVARKGHPGIGRRLDLETLRRLPSVALIRMFRAQGHVNKDLAAHGFDRHIPYAVGKIWAMPWMIAHTDAVGFLPRRFAEAMAENFALQIHASPVPIAEQYIHLMWHERSAEDPGHRWLRETIIEAAKPWGASKT